jgi:acyl-CoA thioesterase I
LNYLIPRNPDLKIVALGDSLTVGENEFELSDSDEYASYPRYLEFLAQRHLNSRQRQSDFKVRVMNKGICGELTAGMLDRFSKDVVSERANCVIVLGGTNDIGWSLEPSIIARNLGMIYDTARNGGVMAVACSIPSVLGLDESIPPRLTLNGMIRTHAEKRSITFVDLFNATADTQTNRLSEQFSGDGLHLNRKGYERMAQCVFDGWLRAMLDKCLEYVE